MPRNDYQKIASAFLDMWQDQVTQAMHNPQFFDSMMQQMQQPFGAQQHEQASSSESPVDGDAELDAVYERLAACEARIAELEQQLRNAKPPQQSNAKPKSKKQSVSRKPRKRAVKKN